MGRSAAELNSLKKAVWCVYAYCGYCLLGDILWWTTMLRFVEMYVVFVMTPL